MKRFYKRFREQLDKSKKLASWKPALEKTDVICEECGAGMVKKWGKNGYFLSCSTYPKCKSTRVARGSRRLSLGEPTPTHLETAGGWLTDICASRTRNCPYRRVRPPRSAQVSAAREVHWSA